VTDDRTAAMLVRVWLEDEGRSFRARVLAVGDDDGSEEDRTVAVVSSPGDLLDAMSQWLEEFIRNGTSSD